MVVGLIWMARRRMYLVVVVVDGVVAVLIEDGNVVSAASVVSDSLRTHTPFWFLVNPSEHSQHPFLRRWLTGKHSSFSKQLSTPKLQILDDSEQFLVQNRGKKSNQVINCLLYISLYNLQLTLYTLAQPLFVLLFWNLIQQHFLIGTLLMCGNIPGIQ